MTDREFVLATANDDKVREISALMPHGYVLHPRPGDIPVVDETGETLAANARLKAASVCAATGMAALADDTGLEVDALDGAPGVRTGRYAGPEATAEENVVTLLCALDGVEAHARTARFRTVALALFPDGRTIAAEGSVEGAITLEPRGREGFGYDPVFCPVEGDGRTFGEMPSAAKNRLSHRARAFARLVDELER